MSLSWPDFVAAKADKPFHYFSQTGATRTVLVCSHIWWTHQIAYAFLQAGCNVLVHFPFFLTYTDPSAAGRFDEIWTHILNAVRDAKVDMIVGGNSAAMLLNPQTGEMVHDAAAAAAGRNVTLVNWWWDEPRTRPPLATKEKVSPADFLRMLANPNTINALWDIDVKEELEATFALKNLIHLPLATLPEQWPAAFVPMESRTLAACFLGNCHFEASWAESETKPLTAWAREIVKRKIANPQLPMQQCIQEVTAAIGGTPRDASTETDPWLAFTWPPEVLNAVYMHYTRNRYVLAAQGHLKGKLALIGKGWEKLGLRANMDHAQANSGLIYGQSKVSLNLFGGCVHGGLPLRPYDIGASGGLIVTHDQRELPSLFEPGKECLTFRTEQEMLALIDQVLAAPQEFNAIAQAGRKRVLAEHAWYHRVKRLLDLPVL